jgi:P-type Cu+ transporter
VCDGDSKADGRRRLQLRLPTAPPPAALAVAAATAVACGAAAVAVCRPGVVAPTMDTGGPGGSGGNGGGGNGGGGGGGGGESGPSPSTRTPPPAAEGAADDDAAPTDVLVLDVGGMHCGGCAATVTRLLEAERGTAGVRGAAVNAATEAAAVRVGVPATVAAAGPAAVSAHLSAVGAYLASVLASRGFPSTVRDSESSSSSSASSSLTAAARAARSKRAAKEAALRRTTADLALASLLGGMCAVGHVACCIPGAPQAFRRISDPRLMAALSGLALLGPGRAVLLEGGKAALLGRPDMNSLVGLGAAATYAVSAAAALLPALKGWPTYFEEPAMLLGAVLAGRALEARAKLRASADSAALYELLPSTARLVVGPAAAGLVAGSAGKQPHAPPSRTAALLTSLRPGGLLRLAAGRRKRRKARDSSSTAATTPAAAAAAALAEGGWRAVPADAVAPGDVLAVLPGDLIPVDGTVLAGRSAVDEAALAGEPLPATKSAGSAVSAGTLNCEGSLLISATRVGSATTIADVVAAVEAAQARAPRIQRAADAVAGRFAAGVLGLAGATAAFWGVAGPRVCPGAVARVAPPNLAAALARAAAAAATGPGAPKPAGTAAAAALLGLQMACNVLVVACPCAVGLAAPTAVLVGAGAGARRGLLLRGGDVLEAAAGLDTVVLDKTGTLTRGVPTVTAFLEAAPPGGRGGKKKVATAPSHALALAAAVERHSAHPVARALVAAADASPAAASPRLAADPDSIVQEAGSGVAGCVGGRAVRVGNWEWVARGLRSGHDHAHLPPLLAGEDGEPSSSSASTAPRALAYVSIDGVLAGAAAIEDELRPDAAATVAALRAAGVTPLLVSGDAPGAVAAVAAAVGIPPASTAACVKPRGKAAIVGRLQAAGHAVGMVGDGVNDAAALAGADVGVAMGGGAGAATDAASLVLLGDRLPALPDALHLARATLAKVHQNLGWALAYNAVAVPLAAGAALPTRLGWALTPAASGALMGVSSLAVMANSLSLRAWGETDPARKSPVPGLPRPEDVAAAVGRAGEAWADGLGAWLAGGGVGDVAEAGDTAVVEA